MNIQNANLDDLLASYYYETQAHVAAENLLRLIREEHNNDLARFLRDYREKSITDYNEISFRAATDRLLNFYSIMEISSFASFIPELTQNDFMMTMQTILSNKYVRNYYEVLYPTKLPKLFLYRILHLNNYKINSEDSLNLLMPFLTLDHQFMMKLEDRLFLRMLDSFTHDGYRFNDVINLIGKPEDFINSLLIDPNERDLLSQALNEFNVFMQFCFDFNQLLNKSESQTLLQSMMWHHYSYWFDILGHHLNTQLGIALSQFLKWNPNEKDSESAMAIQNYVHEATTVLQTLTSSKFRNPVVKLINSIDHSLTL
jgi:hypothetical protein